tara:strand:- start:352 stop:1029 length:678 start_codon:yes stop_codon:yes gene_type:complete
MSKSINIFKFLFEDDKKNYSDAPEKSLHLKDKKVKARKALDSIDDQIDALLIKYEKESIRDDDEEETLAESIRMLSLKYLLLEQDEAPPEEPPTEAPDASAGEDKPEAVPSPTGSEEIDVDEEGEELIPDLDIDKFAAKTVRLISNYENLLRIEEAIVNRVKHYLDQNYGDKHVKRYLEILDTQFGLETNEYDLGDNSDVNEPSPDEDYGLGANPAGAGISGGGG